MIPTRLRPILTALLAAGIASVPSPASAAAPGRPAGPAPTLVLDGAFTGDTDLEAGGAAAGGLSVTQFGARISLPLPPLDQRWFPSVGLRYRQHALDREPGTPLPDRLRSLSLSLGAQGRLTPDWSLFASVSPGFGNAGGGFDSHGFGVGVLAVATRRFSADFSGGIGLRYDSLARGSTRLLPVATLDWSPAPGWRAFLGFPRTGASWKIDDTLTAEFVADMDFGSYHLTADPAPAGSNQPALDRTRLEYKAVRLGPALTWQATPAWRTRLAVGLVPYLEAEYEARDYRLRSDGVAGFASLELDWKF